MKRKIIKEGKGGLVVSIILLAIVSIPVVSLSYLFYFAWDSQMEGNNYKIAFEKEGKAYELNLQGGSLAFDTNELYLNTPYYLSELIALSYDDYDISKTDNPFFGGKIAGKNLKKYFDQETKFTTPKDSHETYAFYDRNHNQIFSYEPEVNNEYVVKLRPTFPAFSKRKYGIGNKRDYINATKILKDKLNKNLKIRTDEANKLLILSFE